MKIESVCDAILHAGRRIAIIVLVLVLLVVVIGLGLGWTGLRDYGFALMLAGIGAWMLGAGSMMGTMSVGGNALHQYARTFSPNTTVDRMRQDAKDRSAGGSFLLLMFAVGIVMIALGLILMALGGPPAPIS